MSRRNNILVSWVAYNHDPYERIPRSDQYRVDQNGLHVRGPTLNFLFDDESPYKNTVGHVLMLSRDDHASIQRVEATFKEIKKIDPEIICELTTWEGHDPTDHKEIFRFLREKIPFIRQRFPEKQLLIHASPGTPAMHTVWVLMCETGFIREPYLLLKSNRPHERQGRPAVEKITVGIDTFYKRYQHARPSKSVDTSKKIFWDPALFKSDTLKNLYESAASIAKLKVPVLILGERGTGKTTLANWIRFNSPYRLKHLDNGWPSVACGQYQPTTMRSELFGYIKGAFTGATENRDGLLARADGDTLFLDEVGDLTRDTQRLLIKAIEERVYQPLGGVDWKKSQFRLITATNVTLVDLKKRLDPDFFDRIAMVILRTPSLREIQDDIPWLWRDVFNKVVSDSGVDYVLSEDSHNSIIRYLKRHSLSGNMRDLYALSWRILAQWPECQHIKTAELSTWLKTAIGIVHFDVDGDLSRKIAERYVENRSLEELISQENPLNTKKIQRDFLAWIGEEIRKVASQRNISPESLVDVTAKTLREWLKFRELR